MAALNMCVRLTKGFLTHQYPTIRTSWGSTSLLTRKLIGVPSEKKAESGDSTTKTEEKTATEKELEKQKQELEIKFAELEDKYKRALAETENVRQRMQRQIQDAKQFGIQHFCKDLLDVADVLTKATESVPEAELTQQNTHLKNLYEGLKMTESQLQKVFRLHGLTQINPLGEKFDPNLHEAMFEQYVEGKEPGSVITVTKIGYQLHSRTVRPAIVGVAKKSPS